MYQTQTIADILEPVAAQVSKLIILHEEGEDGNAMPDLERPVKAVRQAVIHLVKVGQETIKSSQDSLLQNEMPKALQLIENSAQNLENACMEMSTDPYSQNGRDALISGSRCILMGTTAMLVAFDESNVRKLIRDSVKILEYLSIVEVLESYEELVEFVKDLSPTLSKVCKDIEERRSDLLNISIRDSLGLHLEQIKNLAPILICSIKIFIQILEEEGNDKTEEALENRNYLITRMSEEMKEIIRILNDSSGESIQNSLTSSSSPSSPSFPSSHHHPHYQKDMNIFELFSSLTQGPLPPSSRKLSRVSDLGIKIAEGFDGYVKADLISLCNDLSRTSNPFPILEQMEALIRENVIVQVIQELADIYAPLKHFTDAVLSKDGTLSQKRLLVDKRGSDLKIFSHRLTKTADIVSLTNERNKKTSVSLRNLSSQIHNLTPQLIHAGTIKINYPHNNAAEEHFENLRKQYFEDVHLLREQCDESIELKSFLYHTEERIKRSIGNSESRISERSSGKVIVDNTAMAARLSNRLLMALTRECENSDDEIFKKAITAEGESLKNSLTPFLEASRSLVSNLTTENDLDSSLISAWRLSANTLLVSVGNVTRYFKDLNEEKEFSTLATPPPIPPPPRPPLPENPESDDEDGLFRVEPEKNRPIQLAAHGLYQEIKQWDHSDNEIIGAAKKIAFLMASLSELIRGGRGTKRELIACAKGLADQSDKITELAKELARHCTDKKIRTNLLQVCEKIPTLGTQLRVLSTVKATMMAVNMDTEEDFEAMDMLVFNAQKLNQAVKETVRAAESASIRVRSDAGFKLRWVRKLPWFE